MHDLFRQFPTLQRTAADVFTESTTFQVMQSIRLDLGYGSWVHP